VRVVRRRPWWSRRWIKRNAPRNHRRPGFAWAPVIPGGGRCAGPLLAGRGHTIRMIRGSLKRRRDAQSGVRTRLNHYRATSGHDKTLTWLKDIVLGVPLLGHPQDALPTLDRKASQATRNRPELSLAERNRAADPSVSKGPGGMGKEP
jgi:hypothetical protein